MQKSREYLTALLLALLPLHALLVTVGTKLVAGPGNAPMTLLALWKEGLLLLILLIACWEIFKKKTLPKFDRIDLFILVLIILSLIVTFFTHGNWKLYAYGFKYDFFPLAAFMILRRVEWSETFQKLITRVLLSIAGLVCLFGLISLMLPLSFFQLLGYSDLHSLYQPNAPLAPFQQISGEALRRVQSTMSGPNQLGLWLLLPLSIVLSFSIKGSLARCSFDRCSFFSLVAVTLLLTFSRSAVLAAAVMIAVIAFKMFNRKKFIQLIGSIGVLAVLFAIVLNMFAPGIIARAASTKDHLLKPLAAIESIIAHPLGQGLGTAGPASNRISDTCVHLPKDADASWAEAHPQLCVFVDDVQVQPEAECTCPFIPENWYLQIGVELGILGLVLYLVLILMILKSLYKKYDQDATCAIAFLAFLGISVACLFLHAWEDSAIAYSIWILVSLVHAHHSALDA